MATMNVSLPGELKAYVEARVASGDYAGASDLIRDLIRRDKAYREAVAEFQTIIDEATASGIAEGSPEEIRERVRTEARRRATGNSARQRSVISSVSKRTASSGSARTGRALTSTRCSVASGS